MAHSFIHQDLYFRFPLGSLSRSKKSLADEALESFGVTVPLLRFHGVHSWCHSPGKDSHQAADEESHSDNEEDEEDLPQLDDNANANLLDETLSLEKTNGRPALKSHPYVVTR